MNAMKKVDIKVLVNRSLGFPKGVIEVILAVGLEIDFTNVLDIIKKRLQMLI